MGDVAPRVGTLGATSSWEGQGAESAPEPPKGAWPCWHFVERLASRTMGSQCAVLSRPGCGHLLGEPKTLGWGLRRAGPGGGPICWLMETGHGGVCV